MACTVSNTTACHKRVSCGKVENDSLNVVLVTDESLLKPPSTLNPKRPTAKSCDPTKVEDSVAESKPKSTNWSSLFFLILNTVFGTLLSFVQSIIAFRKENATKEKQQSAIGSDTSSVLTMTKLTQRLDALLDNGVDYKKPAIFNAVQKLMEAYDPCKCSQWRKYHHFDNDEIYSRNLICKGRGYTLLLLVWPPNCHSVIHNHGGSQCWLRILQATLVEQFYDVPKDNDPLKLVFEKEHKAPGVCFINDESGLHRIANKSESEWSCSLHCYVPGFESCLAFLDAECAANAKSCHLSEGSYASIGGVVPPMRHLLKIHNECSAQRLELESCDASKTE